MASDTGPPEDIDPRVIDQRLRNRIAESLTWLAEGEAGVTSMGAGEYVNQFFDWVDEDRDGWEANTALTVDEVVAIRVVRDAMNALCDAAPQDVVDTDLIGTRLLNDVVVAAAQALAVIDSRGRFGEEVVDLDVHRPHPMV